MKMTTNWYKRIFHFKAASGTSRGILTEKHSWFIELEQDGIKGVGECSVIEGLSPDFTDVANYEAKIKEVLTNLEEIDLKDLSCVFEDLINFPSIVFGLETALMDLKNGGKGIYFYNDFTRGNKRIPINGLIWMGSESFMMDQIERKIADGFSTIKMKIGAIDFETEVKLLKSVRDRFSVDEMTLRVDANGAFSFEDARPKLEILSKLDIHSIEQPIKQGQWTEMARLCAETPIPIALDEELIGINDRNEKKKLLQEIRPQFIILKPSLHGGIVGTNEWISLAQKQKIDWWITSALESNIGLDAICQFTAEFENPLPQGLGTGSLYIDNSPSNLEVKNGFIFKNTIDQTLSH